MDGVSSSCFSGRKAASRDQRTSSPPDQTTSAHPLPASTETTGCFDKAFCQCLRKCTRADNADPVSSPSDQATSAQQAPSSTTSPRTQPASTNTTGCFGKARCPCGRSCSPQAVRQSSRQPSSNQASPDQASPDPTGTSRCYVCWPYQRRSKPDTSTASTADGQGEQTEQRQIRIPHSTILPGLQFSLAGILGKPETFYDVPVIRFMFEIFSYL